MVSSIAALELCYWLHAGHPLLICTFLDAPTGCSRRVPSGNDQLHGRGPTITRKTRPRYSVLRSPDLGSCHLFHPCCRSPSTLSSRSLTIFPVSATPSSGLFLFFLVVVPSAAASRCCCPVSRFSSRSGESHGPILPLAFVLGSWLAADFVCCGVGLACQLTSSTLPRHGHYLIAASFVSSLHSKPPPSLIQRPLASIARLLLIFIRRSASSLPYHCRRVFTRHPVCVTRVDKIVNLF